MITKQQQRQGAQAYAVDQYGKVWRWVLAAGESATFDLRQERWQPELGLTWWCETKAAATVTVQFHLGLELDSKLAPAGWKPLPLPGGAAHIAAGKTVKGNAESGPLAAIRWVAAGGAATVEARLGVSPFGTPFGGA